MREHASKNRSRNDRPFEIDILIPGLGAATGRKTDRFRCSAETRDARVYQERRRMVYDIGQRLLHNVLVARLDGRVSTEQLAHAYKQGNDALLALIEASHAALLAPLRDRWTAHSSARSKWEGERHLNSFIAYCGGEASATVSDLTAERIGEWLASLVDRRRGRSGARRSSDSPEAKSARVRRQQRSCNAQPRPVSHATRNRHRASLSAFCTYAMNVAGVLRTHPLRERRVPKHQEADPRMPHMTAEQWEAYCKALGNDPLAPEGAVIVARILRHTAADVGEVIGYTSRLDGRWVPGFLVKDIDANRRLPRIAFKRHKVAKSKWRSVPYIAKHIDELLAHIAARGLTPNDPVFGGFDRGAFERAHDRVCKAIGCPEINLKDFRHLAAISWAQGAARLERICEWMGHASIRQTVIYARFAPDDTFDGPVAERAALIAEGEINGSSHPTDKSLTSRLQERRAVTKSSPVGRRRTARPTHRRSIAGSPRLTPE